MFCILKGTINQLCILRGQLQIFSPSSIFQHQTKISCLKLSKRVAQFSVPVQYWDLQSNLEILGWFHILRISENHQTQTFQLNAFLSSQLQGVSKKRFLRDWHPKKWFQGQPVKMCRCKYFLLVVSKAVNAHVH